MGEPMKRLRMVGVGALLQAMLAVVFSVGCDDGGDGGEGGGLVAVILADPLTGPAPLDVAFDLRIQGAGPEDELLCEWDFGDGRRTEGCSTRHAYPTPRSEPYVVVAGVTNTRTGETATAEPVSILVTERPDLVLVSGAFSPGQVDSGQDITLDLTVANRGGWEAPPSSLCFELEAAERGATYELRTSRDGSRAVDLPGLAPGESTDLTALALTVRRGMPGGVYSVVVILDCDQEVSEADEEDDRVRLSGELRVTASTEGPDLVVRSMEVSPATVMGSFGDRGPTIDLTLVLGNAGNRLAGPFGWEVYLSDDETLDPEVDTRIAMGELPGLQPNTTERVEVTSVELPAGIQEGHYQIIGVVDPDDVLQDEIDETNNATLADGGLTVISGQVEGFDLIPTVIRLESYQVPQESGVDVSFTLCNRGTLDIRTNFFCTVVVSPDQMYDEDSDVTLGNVNLMGLPAQTCIDARLTKLLPPTVQVGSYYVGVRADPPDAVPEADETNNTIWNPTPLRVANRASVDVSVRDVTFSPSEIQAGDLLTVSFTLRNESNYRSGAFKSVIVISPDEEIGPDDRRLKEVVTPALNGATDLPVQELVPIPLDVDHRVAEWYVGVVVDPDDEVIGEPDESNNVARAPGTLVITGGGGGCFEDVFEPNDTMDEAAQIGVGEHEGLGRCGNDDWYGILVQAGERLLVTLTHDPTQGNLELELYSQDGELVDASRGTGERKVVAALLPPSDTLFYIHVAGHEDGENQYDLDVELQGPVEGVDLTAHRVTLAQERVILGQPVEFTFQVLNLGTEAAGPSSATVYSSADSTLDQDDPILGTLPVPQVPATSRVEVSGSLAMPQGPSSGEYLLLVQVDSGEVIQEADEDNNVAASEQTFEYLVPEDCEDDPLEPNNVCQAASPIEPGTLGDLTVCQDFDDWFALDLVAMDFVRITIGFTHRDGDLDLQVYGPDCETLVAQSRGARDQEQVEFMVDQTGRYFVRVFYFLGQSGSNGYSLTYDLIRCQRDRFEPNDRPDQARAVSLAGEQGLTTCGDDIDYYLVDLIQGREVTIRADVTDGPPLSITLYQWSPPNPPLFLRSRMGQPLTYTPQADGTYLLKVQQLAGEITEYDLVIEGLDGLDLQASSLTLVPGEALPGGIVQLSATVDNRRARPVERVAWALYLSSDAQLDPRVDTEVARGEATDIGPGERVVVEDRVFLPPNIQPGVYTAFFVLDPDGELDEEDETNDVAQAGLTVAMLCRPDGFEPNDTPDQAPDLAEGIYQDLTICRGDVDLFRIEVPEGTTSLTVRLDHDAAIGDLDLFLLGSDGQEVVAASTTEDDTEETALHSPTPGAYYVKVQALGVQENSYALTVDLTQ